MPRYVNIEKYEQAYIGMDIAVNFSDGAMVGCAGEVFAKVIPVSKIPTADVQEVVRCKDCKYLMFSDMYGECSHAILGIVSPDDYCSRGEKKDGDK